MLAFLLVWVTLAVATKVFSGSPGLDLITRPYEHCDLWIPTALIGVLCLLPFWPGSLTFSIWLGYAVTYTLTALLCEWLMSLAEIARLAQYQATDPERLANFTHLNYVLVNLFLTPWLLLVLPVEDFLQASSQAPTVWWHLVLLPVMGDVYFTVVHHTLHCVTWLRPIHGEHHHTLLPTAWHTLDCHMLEHLFLNMSSVGLPLYVVRPSFTVCYIFVLLSMAYATTSHSGLDRMPGAKRHCLHHWDCTCNFGVLGITEWALSGPSADPVVVASM